MRIWTGKDVQDKCEWAGLSLTNPKLAEFLAAMLNDAQRGDTRIQPKGRSSAGDCMVHWTPTWKSLMRIGVGG